MSINVSWPTDQGTKQAVVPLPCGGIAPLRAAIEERLGSKLPPSCTLTDTLRDITNDDDVAALRDGATLVVAQGGALGAPARERITFQPHPKTLTMAGDYEYFAAQGRHPFVFALAEFIDNSLRATRANAPRPRAITITLATAGSGAARRGLVCVQDNGCGMTKRELNDWAVMNYSMEERGAAPREPEAEGRGGAPAAAAGRFLTGDLSFFGVGSKNAAFFMGASVKMATRKAGERYVHELALSGAELESRYRAGEAVYEEEMVHRNPGDDSTLSAMEGPFAAARAWVAAETEPAACGDGGAFTRVVIGDLKPEILQQVSDDVGGDAICRELAHLYHYYIHGEGGNRGGAPQATHLPNGEALPAISLRATRDATLLWERSLAGVEDDMETRTLRAQRAEFPFTLAVPDRGTVGGVLYYFPYENDRETVPAEAAPAWTVAANRGGGGGGATQVPVPSQHPGRTQAGAGGTQLPGGRTQAGGSGPLPGGSGGGSPDDASDDEGAGGGAAWREPIFKTFWQGRVIPGSSVESLPFLEAVRSKRATAAARDALPDEAFARLRGALFFGPAFKVTRNKLLFRENLPELLAAGVPGDRGIEKRFKAWLGECHARLDKSYRFERPADSRTQAALRARLGEGVTAFEQVSDGARGVAAGDVVRLAAKPAVVGRVLYFTVPQAVREDGAYANGRVHVDLLPLEIHAGSGGGGGGAGAPKDYSLRRLEAVLTDAEAEEHCAKELGRLPAAVRVEPMRFATGQAVEMAAGDDVPETTVTVANAAGQRLTRSFYNGEKQSLVVTQRLWRLPREGAALPAADGAGDAGGGDAGAPEADPAEGDRPSKRARKGRGKGKRAAAEEGGPAEPGAAAVAELVVSVDNRTPCRDAFAFNRISDGMKRAGHYLLEYIVGPAVAGQPAVRAAVPLSVAPGPAAALKIGGEGAAAAAARDIVMGETIPAFAVFLCDEYGNEVAPAPGDEDRLKVAIMAPGAAEGAALERVRGLGMKGDCALEAGHIRALNLRFAGTKKANIANGGLPFFQRAAAAAGGGEKAPAAVGSLPAALVFSLGDGSVAEGVVQVRVRPGAPNAVALLPGGPWDGPGAAASVQSGAELLEFSVQAYDAWGTRTAPIEDLPFQLGVEGEALAGDPPPFDFNAAGVATVSGLRAATGHAGAASLALTLRCGEVGGGMATALEVARPHQELTLPLQVLPSALPAAIQILDADGNPLPVEERPNDEGRRLPTALLSGVEAGTKYANLRVVLLDESGAPAAQPAAGRLQVYWFKGSRKVAWNGEPVKLPAVPAPDSTSETLMGWVRFTGDSGGCSLNIEIDLWVTPVAGAPASWAVALVDQVTSQAPDQQGFVQGGEPFALEIEALDRLNNRCAGGGAGALPEPVVELEADGPLEFDPGSWERAWVAQGREEVYTMRMALRGHPGDVRVRVRDGSGADGASLLASDCLTMELRSGPPHGLAFVGPAAGVDCGLRAALGGLEVELRDAGGYPTAAAEGFEVTLAASALATDGSGRAAKVTAVGGNKVKIGRGKGGAAFRNVTVAAEAPGTYALRVQSASRKVALEEGVLVLNMAPLTAVTGLTVAVPEELSAGAPAGTAHALAVAVETENGEPLPADVAAEGLQLRVTPPGGAKADAAAVALPEGAAPEADAAWAFPLTELTKAGTWTAVAEFAEPRADVRAAMDGGGQLRSAAVQFAVLPGPPVAAAVEATGQLPDRVAVTNAPAAKARLLVRNAAVQVRDGWGNAAAEGAEGVAVRFRLRAAGALAPGAALPELEVEEGGGAQTVNERGRAFFGKLAVAAGTGAAPGGPLECELVCEALGLHGVADDVDEEGWAVAWRCCVLFSDNAETFAAAERLNDQRQRLGERRAGLAERLEAARGAAATAERQEQRAAAAAAAVADRVAGDLPRTVQAAEKQLKKLRDAVAAGEAAEAAPPARQARWGSPKSPLTGALDAALRLGDPGVVGVVAKLITVDHERLATVASYAVRGLLNVLVVADSAARERVAAELAAKKYPIPDVMPLTQVFGFRGPKGGDTPGFTVAGALAHELTRAACGGTDRPLPLPLPHQRGPRDALGYADWPRGCLGFLCNLVRPAVPGHRASVIHAMFPAMLVFESLKDATDYREAVTQGLKIGFPHDVITLDGGRLSSRGIISGSAYAPVPLERADFVIGAAGEGGPGGSGGAGPAQRAEEMAAWAEALREREAAAAAADAARQELERAEGECGPELEGVAGEMADVDAQIGRMRGAQEGEGAGGSGQKRPRRGGRGAAAAEEEAPAAAENEGDNQEGQTDKKGARGKRRRTARG